MPKDGLETLKSFDAIFFGSVGAPDVPDHITLWGLRLPICQGFDQYANVRPTRILPGITAPLRNKGHGDLDWVIVRENSEGEYSGSGGRAHQGYPEEVATEVAIFTRTGVTRIMRYAFELARERPRKQLTVVTKSNAQRHGMVMWDEITAGEVSAEYPDVSWDKMLVDAMTVRMTLHPAVWIRSLQPICMPIFCLIWQVRWQAVSVWRQQPILIRNVAFHPCSSLFTAQHLILPEKVLRTLLRPSGPPVKCWNTSASQTHHIALCVQLRLSAQWVS